MINPRSKSMDSSRGRAEMEPDGGRACSTWPAAWEWSATP